MPNTKIKLFEYELPKGNSFKIHDSIHDCAIDLNEPELRKHFDYKCFYITERNTVVFKQRKLRHEILFEIEKSKNKLILSPNDKPVILMNMENIEVARFASIYIASMFTGDSHGTILGSIDRKGSNIPKNKHRTYWKYA